MGLSWACNGAARCLCGVCPAAPSPLMRLRLQNSISLVTCNVLTNRRFPNVQPCNTPFGVEKKASAKGLSQEGLAGTAPFQNQRGDYRYNQINNFQWLRRG